ncbi:unnamed protein product, partial [Amoebophrya sp. A25]|eukprot:GSA25T00008295001.1
MVFSPSVLLFYLGFNKKIPNLLHHNFFFDTDLDENLKNVFALLPAEHRKGRDKVLGPQGSSSIGKTDAEQKDATIVRMLKEAVRDFTFYVSATSKTDSKAAYYPHSAPSSSSTSSTNHREAEALFVLIPTPYTLNDILSQCGQKCNGWFWTHLLDDVFRRMEQKLELPRGRLRQTLVYERHAGTKEFETGFNSYRGNAFGLANTLTQSLILKPSLESKVPNLVFAGHLTNPGPGVPPSLVSGVVSANLLDQKLKADIAVDPQSLSSSAWLVFFFRHIFLAMWAVSRYAWLFVSDELPETFLESCAWTLAKVFSSSDEAYYLDA